MAKLNQFTFTIQNVSIKYYRLRGDIFKETNLQYKMFLLNPTDSFLIYYNSKFTIQNVSIKSRLADCKTVKVIDLQYKMFLLNLKTF